MAEEPGVPVLEAEGLCKQFRSPGSALRLRARSAGRTAGTMVAVRDVSLRLYPARSTALVGESGSGKSTVVRLLCGLHRPSAGKILVDGHTVSVRGNRQLRAHTSIVQMVFQDPFASLNAVHTVGYQLRRPLLAHGYSASGPDLCELLSTVSLTPPQDYLARHPHELSGGQQQRVAIARALAARPRVLLADEPVSMLDVSIRLGVLNLLAELKQQRSLAMLYVTHDIASARYFSEEMLVMYAGELIEGGDSESVTQLPAHPYTRLLISSAPDPRRRGTVHAAQPLTSLVGGAPGGGCPFVSRCPHALEACTVESPARTELGDGHWVRCHLYRNGAQPDASPSRLSATERLSISE